jgi:RNA-directed DNA polymerase
MSDRGGWIVPAAQAVATLPHRPQTHSLMPLLGARFLARALREGGRRRSAPGADRITWAAYRRAAAVRIPRLAGALREGTWRPGPVREVTIYTSTGKQLLCVLPTVEDRIVQRAMRSAIEPILGVRLRRLGIGPPAGPEPDDRAPAGDGPP